MARLVYKVVFLSEKNRPQTSVVLFGGKEFKKGAVVELSEKDFQALQSMPGFNTVYSFSVKTPKAKRSYGRRTSNNTIKTLEG